MLPHCFLLVFLLVVCFVEGLMLQKPSTFAYSGLYMSSNYFEEVLAGKGVEKRCLVGFTTDSWNIGQKKYKDFLAVYKVSSATMYKYCSSYFILYILFP